MVPALTLSIVVFLVGLGFWGIATGATRRMPGRPLLVATLIAEAELVIQAAAAAVAIAAGHRPESTGEWVGYAIVTVGMIPFAWNRARGPHATPFDAAVLGIVCLVTAVAVLRLLSLW